MIAVEDAEFVRDAGTVAVFVGHAGPRTVYFGVDHRVAQHLRSVTEDEPATFPVLVEPWQVLATSEGADDGDEPEDPEVPDDPDTSALERTYEAYRERWHP